MRARKHPKGCSKSSRARRVARRLALAVGLAWALAAPLGAQTLVGTIKKDGWVPTVVQVDETHNKVFVADDTTHKVFIFDGATHAELGSAATNLDPAYSVVDMVVDEAHQKLYAAPFDLYGKIAVIDTATGSFVKTIDLAFPGTFAMLAKDEGLGKVYVLCNGGFGQIDVATDAVTWVDGVNGNPNRRLAVNPVTHEVFISNWMSDKLDIVDGVTLTHTQIPDMQGLGVAVNWVENKVYVMFGQPGVAGVDYWCKVIDRDTGTIDVLSPFDIDPTEMRFNPLTNRMYTSPETLWRAGILDGATNAVRRLPLAPIESSNFAVRNATDHVYYLNDQPIEVLDPTTEVVERLAIDTPGTGGSVIYQGLLINQTTGRVYALPWSADDPAAYNAVLVIQDTDRLTRLPVFTPGGSGVAAMDPVSKRWGRNLQRYGGYTLLGMAVSPGGGRIYLPTKSSPIDPADYSLSVLAGSGEASLLANIPTGGTQSVAAAVTPDGSRVYVTNSGSGNVGVIDTASNLFVTAIPVGTSPWGIAVSPDGDRIYVALQGANSVAVINTSSDTVAGTIPVGSAPWGVAFNPSATFAYVSNSASDNVSVIDVGLGVVITNVAVGSTPQWLSVTPDGKQVYVTNSGAHTVSVIDIATNTVVQTVDVGAQPQGVAASPDGSVVYVSTSWDGGSDRGYISAFAFINRGDYSVIHGQEADAWDSFGGAGDVAVADPTSKFAGRINATGCPARVRALQGGVEKGSATTNAAGDYAIFNLLPGTYDLEASAAGFVTQTLVGQAVGAGRTTLANFTLLQGTRPVPAISSLSPSSAAVGGPGFNLLVNGSNFFLESVVRWNGSPRPTQFAACGQLTASIPAGDIATPGTAEVKVFTPAPGGGLSSGTTFYVTSLFSNTNSIVIPDSSSPPTPSVPYPSNIVVSGLSGTITKLSVKLNGFSHTFPDDVDILLVAPNGANAIIMSDVGGSTAVTGVDLLLDDAAASPLPDDGPLVSGTFRPTNIGAGDSFPSPAPTPSGSSALSTFSGINPNGTWSLYIVGDSAGNSGSLAGGWSLIISGPTGSKKGRSQVTSD